MLKTLRFVFYSELLLLLRRSQEWVYPLAFFGMVLIIFPIAFSPETAFLQKYVSGCVWIATLFASILSVENFFHADIEDGGLDQLMLSNTSLPLIMLVKMAAHWLVWQLPILILLPLIGVLFHLSFYSTLLLIISLFLGSPILLFVGCLGVALTLGLRQQGVLLGLLVLPLLIPVLIFGVSVGQADHIIGPLAFLAGLSILSMALLPLAIASVIKISF